MADNKVDSLTNALQRHNRQTNDSLVRPGKLARPRRFFMTRLLHRFTLSVALCGLTLAALAASAEVAYAQKGPPRQVQDDAGMFTAKAKEQANSEIARIKKDFHKDLLIETVPQGPKLPADVKDKTSEAKFFDQWALSRFKNEHVDGVYVVIVEKPHIIRVAEGDTTLSSGLFTASNRDELRQKMIEKLKAKDNDGALLAATHYVREAMTTNRGATRNQSGGKSTTQPAPSSSNEPRTTAPAHPGGEPRTNWVTWLLIGVGVFLVLWIIIAIFRAISGAGR